MSAPTEYYDPQRHDEDQRGKHYHVIGAGRDRGQVIAQSARGVYVESPDKQVTYFITQGLG
jgi:hypothetical protein